MPISAPPGTRAAGTAPRWARVRPGAGFWTIAAAFLTATAFSLVTSPLWPIYQRDAGFTTMMVTAAFATYAVGVAASLMLAGQLSDQLGRRRVLLPAILLEAGAAALYLTSTHFAVVVTARLLTGLAVGMIVATATAYLDELHAAARPGVGRARVGSVATAANLGGFAVGALSSGLLAQYADAPLRTPFLVFLCLLLLAAAGIALAPETVPRRGGPLGYRVRRIAVPAAARGRFFYSALGQFASSAVLSLFGSVVPGFVATDLHRPSRLLSGGIVCLVFVAAAGTQALLGRVHVRRQLGLGVALVVLGTAAVAGALWVPQLPLLVLGAAASGAGTGLLLKATVTIVLDVAEPAVRGEALAGLFLAGYLGLSVPVLGFGAAVTAVSDRAAMAGFTAVTAVLMGILVWGLFVSRGGRRGGSTAAAREPA